MAYVDDIAFSARSNAVLPRRVAARVKEVAKTLGMIINLNIAITSQDTWTSVKHQDRWHIIQTIKTASNADECQKEGNFCIRAKITDGKWCCSAKGLILRPKIGHNFSTMSF